MTRSGQRSYARAYRRSTLLPVTPHDGTRTTETATCQNGLLIRSPGRRGQVRPSNVSEKVRPKNFAVLRLSTNSTFHRLHHGQIRRVFRLSGFEPCRRQPGVRRPAGRWRSSLGSRHREFAQAVTGGQGMSGRKRRQFLVARKEGASS